MDSCECTECETFSHVNGETEESRWDRITRKINVKEILPREELGFLTSDYTTNLQSSK